MKDLEINIEKTWRKSLSLRFDTHGVLQVRAPKFVSQSQIETFIQKNTSWIEKHHASIQEQLQDKKHYIFGEELDPSSMYDFGASAANISEKLKRYYVSEAKKYLKHRTQELASQHGFHYDSIRITSAKTRWGSCSSNKTINFSYRLIMASKQAIDYVIIHELCHLREMNHSERFWAEVENIMPEYKTWEKYLKVEGRKFRL